MYEEQQPALKWLREQFEAAVSEFRVGDDRRLNSLTQNNQAFQMYFHNVMRIPAMSESDWLSYPGNIKVLEGEFGRFQEAQNAKSEIAELKDSNNKLTEELDQVKQMLAQFIESQKPEPEKKKGGKKPAVETEATEDEADES